MASGRNHRPSVERILSRNAAPAFFLSLFGTCGVLGGEWQDTGTWFFVGGTLDSVGGIPRWRRPGTANLSSGDPIGTTSRLAGGLKEAAIEVIDEEVLAEILTALWQTS
jgi:hypothetical protein